MAKPAYDIAVLPGDGIGPEVVAATQAVLAAATTSTGIDLRFTSHECGAALYQRSGTGITDETMAEIGRADAILLGAMGLPSVRKADGTEVTPQIDIREHYHLYASLRPVRLFDGVKGALRTGSVDMLVIRETTEGLFAGRHDPRGVEPDSVSSRLTITRATSERLFAIAFAQAASRKKAGCRGKVTLLG